MAIWFILLFYYLFDFWCWCKRGTTKNCKLRSWTITSNVKLAMKPQPRLTRSITKIDFDIDGSEEEEESSDSTSTQNHHGEHFGPTKSNSNGNNKNGSVTRKTTLIRTKYEYDDESDESDQGDDDNADDIPQNIQKSNSNPTSNVRWRNKSGRRTYHCNYCDKKFNYKGSYDRHTRIHTGEKPYKCDKCDRSYTDETSLKYHIQHTVHTANGTGNGIQILESKVKSEPKNAITNLNLSMGEFKCGHCERKFHNTTQLERHMLIHTNGGQEVLAAQTQSDEDYADFSGEAEVELPVKIRSDQKQISCPICRKFLQKYNLPGHLRTHTGEKPFKCSKCKICFRDYSNFRRHISPGKKCHGATNADKHENEFKSSKVRVKSRRVTKSTSSTSTVVKSKRKWNLRIAAPAKKSELVIQSKLLLITHTKSHNETDKVRLLYPCKYCQMDFEDKSDVFEHMLCHQGK